MAPVCHPTKPVSLQSTFSRRKFNTLVIPATFFPFSLCIIMSYVPFSPSSSICINTSETAACNKQTTNKSCMGDHPEKGLFLLCPATYNPLLMLSISQSRGKSEVSHNENNVIYVHDTIYISKRMKERL